MHVYKEFGVGSCSELYIGERLGYWPRRLRTILAWFNKVLVKAQVVMHIKIAEPALRSRFTAFSARIPCDLSVMRSLTTRTSRKSVKRTCSSKKRDVRKTA